MEIRFKYIGLNIIFLPVVFYLVWVHLDELKGGVVDFSAVAISSFIGIMLATAYGEYIAFKIWKFYFLITLLSGLSLLILIYAINLDDLVLINPMSLYLSFFLVAYGYKNEVLTNLRS